MKRGGPSGLAQARRAGLWMGFAALAFSFLRPGLADEGDPCRRLPDAADRLACYDRAADLRGTPAPPGSLLSELWDITPDQTRRVLKIRAHRVNYFLPVRHSDAPNQIPQSPSLGPATIPAMSSSEAKFQISIKTRVLQGLLDDRLDVWLGYTQQAHWQVYSESSPFREVNFEPEIMALWRVERPLAGLSFRFVNLGLVHQSNGRGGAESRSWNRLYAQFGFERGDNLALLLRPWWRIPEKTSNDNNPDLPGHVGRMDAVALFRLQDHAFEGLLRNNLSVGTNRGAVQFSWYFPLYRGLKGYLQVFNGYGESLIDYNHPQTTVGLGVALVDWM